ncbi:MAG: T9SS type A sorting domain-containing protein [bacterium]
MQNRSIQINVVPLLSKKHFTIHQTIILTMLLVLIPVVCEAQNLLKQPQKIVIDAKRNLLMASNYQTGDIVAIDSARKQTYFVKKAGFIDGLEIVGDTIYGAGNNRKILAYNLETKSLVMDVQLPPANPGDDYLSSITSDSSGHLFISCPGVHTIYKFRISDQAYWVFAKDNGLNRPNGMLLEREKNRLVVIDDSPKPSLIHAISLFDSTVSVLDTTNFKQPDGIVRDKFGTYYVGGYYLPGIYKIDPEFSQPPVLIRSGDSFVYPTYDPADNSLIVASYNRNSWERISLLTNIDDSINLPSRFSLFQNYPNPFNPTTIISFQLSVSSNVQLKICDVLGREAAELVNEYKHPGSYKVEFDGSNLPSGIYFYELVAGEYRESKKMILLK